MNKLGTLRLDIKITKQVKSKLIYEFGNKIDMSLTS